MCLHRSVLYRRCQLREKSRGEREKAVGVLTDLKDFADIEENQVGKETVVIEGMRAFLNPEEIGETEETEETEEPVGIEGRTESQNFPASVGLRVCLTHGMAPHLVRSVEGFADFVLEVEKGGNCLLAGIVMREVLVLVNFVVDLVAGIQPSQRQLNRHHPLVDPQMVVPVAEDTEAVGQAQEQRE